MDVKFVAFESLGVRSQALFIQLKNANIFIDPSAALAPRRFGLPPHIYEVEKLLDIFNTIENYLRDSDIVIHTHYHYDHHDPGRFLDIDLYRGKIVYLKDPQNYINISQKIRASRFIKMLKNKAEDILIADGRKESSQYFSISFSTPLPHGESDKLGYVVSVCIEEKDDTLLFTSDIEGGPLDIHRNLLSFCKPRIAVIDGPPTYLVGYRYSDKSLKSSISFILKFLELEPLEVLVLDHHLCRDLNYFEGISEVIDKARSLNKEVKTAAEAIGLKPLLLEAMRRELYREKPENGLNKLKSRYRFSELKELDQIFGED
ncbi:MAG: hypothetical protein LM582_03935 [Desulfurococcaceae archaeon]|nr:hypothetical protein [Desulfurococcaceae archaeon]